MSKKKGHFGVDRRAVLAGLGAVGVSAFSRPSYAQGLTIDGKVIGDQALLEAARNEESLYVYGANFERHERALIEAFLDDTGMSGFELLRLQTGRMFERAMSEFSAGVLPADTLSLNDLIIMEKMREAGIFAAHRVPSWDELDSELKQPEGYYYAQQRFANGVGYNTARWPEGEAPKRWADLLDPKFKDEIGIIPMGSGGNSFSVYMFMRKVLGTDYWEKLAANGVRLYTSYSPLSDDIARGEVTVGISTASLMTALQDAGAPVGFAMMAEGVPTAVLYAGVISSASSPNRAKLYLNWLTSKRGASMTTEITKDYSGRNDIPPPDLSKYGIEMPAPSALWAPTLEQLTDEREAAIEEWNSLFRT